MDLGLNDKQIAQYQVGRAILAAATGRREGGSFEMELSADISRKLGRPTQTGNSVFVPTRLRPQATALDTKSSAAGNYTVQTTAIELVEALRQQNRCVELGAVLMDGLTANISFPTENATTSATWVPENPGSDVSATDPSFVLRTATPHALQGTTSLSKQLLIQNSVQVENFIRRSLTRSHAIALDAAAIAGTGTQNQPVGLLKQANLPTVAIGADGGAATYASLCSLEETVALANADSPSIAFLTTPTQRKKLRGVFVNGTGSEPAWDDEMPGPLGYRGAVSTAVPSNIAKGNGTNLSAIIAGNFSFMILSEFGVMEIVVDPFAGKKQGMVELTSFGMYDIVFQQIGAFAVIADAS